MEVTIEEIIVLKIHDQKGDERKYIFWDSTWYLTDGLHLKKIDSESSLVPLLNTIIEMNSEINK